MQAHDIQIAQAAKQSATPRPARQVLPKKEAAGSGQSFSSMLEGLSAKAQDVSAPQKAGLADHQARAVPDGAEPAKKSAKNTAAQPQRDKAVKPAKHAEPSDAVPQDVVDDLQLAQLVQDEPIAIPYVASGVQAQSFAETDGQAAGLLAEGAAVAATAAGASQEAPAATYAAAYAAPYAPDGYAIAFDAALRAQSTAQEPSFADLLDGQPLLEPDAMPTLSEEPLVAQDVAAQLSGNLPAVTRDALDDDSVVPVSDGGAAVVAALSDGGTQDAAPATPRQEQLPLTKAERQDATEQLVEQKPLVTVTDMRTAQAQDGGDTTGGQDDEPDSQRKEFRVLQTDGHGAAIMVSLASDAEQNILSSSTQSAQAASSTFQQMLSEQMQANAPEFVKAANFVLKDDNQGTIDMILRPQQLGNVKVSLQLSDKLIAGHITVASKEALEAFKQSMDTLRQAFVQSGFDGADLTLSLADGTSAGNAGGQEQASGQFAPGDGRSFGRQAGSEASAGTGVASHSVAVRADGSRYAVDVVA